VVETVARPADCARRRDAPLVEAGREPALESLAGVLA